uniref:Beta-Casp domain-containing protein n=1 Tax=Arcella intermedia TaxID=1963864 RepID=A0A6B2KZ24_9EUKA
MPLGAGNEVGRSCLLMKFKGKTIMLDCGIHPAYTGLNALPFFDELEDPSSIDLLLVSHFHLDHIAALPYFLEKTTFKGRVFMTHPTKAIYKMLLTDYIRISNIAIEDMLFDEQDLTKSMDKIEQINFHQELEHAGVKFWCYNAGHVLGAAMFMVEIAGVKVLYTGDFSRQEDRHLMAAEIPELCPDVLVVESTYGVQIHEPRKERESRFCGTIHNIVKRGGRCLIPVFALGRAQELLLILEEYWASHSDLKNVPIYYASTLGKKCMTVYQTYISMMNEKIRQQAPISNPFVFSHIQDLTTIEEFKDTGPCVVMASPGMLQSGLSRQLFELWCQSKKNGVMIPGYCVEGTLAKTILSEPGEVQTMDGRLVPLNMSVHYISFSAHTDFVGTSTFIDKLSPPNVILVHGEKNEMNRLQQSLLNRYEGKKIEILTPRNCQTVKLQFKGQKTAKAVGNIAAGGPQHLARMSGLLVQKDYQYTLVDPVDLHTYTKLQTSEVTQTLSVPYQDKWDTLKYQLEQMFDDVKDSTFDDKLALQVHDSLYVVCTSSTAVTLEWVANPVLDMLSDSIVSIIFQINANPASYSVEKQKPRDDVDVEKLALVEKHLAAHYGNVTVDNEKKTITINLDGTEAVYKLSSNSVSCADEQFKEQIEDLLKYVHGAVFPIKGNRENKPNVT